LIRSRPQESACLPGTGAQTGSVRGSGAASRRIPGAASDSLGALAITGIDEEI
jgi:hypothetical protein